MATRKGQNQEVGLFATHNVDGCLPMRAKTEVPPSAQGQPGARSARACELHELIVSDKVQFFTET